MYLTDQELFEHSSCHMGTPPSTPAIGRAMNRVVNAISFNMHRVVISSRRAEFISAVYRAQNHNLPICLICQHRQAAYFPRCSPFSSASAKSAASDSKWIDRVTTRTRQRIWGTDNPPGADDPYTGRSLVKPQDSVEGGHESLDAQTAEDVRTYEEQARKEDKKILQAAVDDALNHEAYVPANTWDGIENVGGEKEWDSGRQFKGYVKYFTMDRSILTK